jgi:hypothetical protein
MIIKDDDFHIEILAKVTKKNKRPVQVRSHIKIIFAKKWEVKLFGKEEYRIFKRCLKHQKSRIRQVANFFVINLAGVRILQNKDDGTHNTTIPGYLRPVVYQAYRQAGKELGFQN